MEIKPYDYQEGAINQVFSDFGLVEQRQQADRIALVAPTGAGKTFIFAFIARRFVLEFGMKVNILVHRAELVEQTIESLNSIGIDNVFKLTANCSELRKGLFDGKRYVQDCDVVVSMVETLHSRQYPEIMSSTVTIVDESHMRNFDKVVTEVYSKYILGVTATPQRLGKGTKMCEVYDKMIEVTDVNTLVDNGKLTPAIYFSFNSATDDGLKKSGNDYTQNSHFEASVKQRFDASAGIVELHSKIYEYSLVKGTKRWLKMIMFCAGVKQAEREMEILNQKFGKGGAFCKAITGNMSKEEREQTLQDHKNNKFPLLINVNVLTAGYDDKSIECVILNRKTLSLALFVQMVGRGLRTYPNKDYCYVLDLWANNEKHGRYGMKDEPLINWETHFFGVKKKEGVAPMKECQGCGALNHASAPTCVVCDLPFPKKEKEEEVLTQGLQLVKGKKKVNHVDNWYKTKIPLIKTPELVTLAEECRNKGYKKGAFFRQVFQTGGTELLKQLGRELGYKPSWYIMQMNQF